MEGGDPAALDLYDRQRRPTNVEYIQKVSMENKKRNEEMDLAVRAATFDGMETALSDDKSRFAFLYRWCMALVHTAHRVELSGESLAEAPSLPVSSLGDLTARAKPQTIDTTQYPAFAFGRLQIKKVAGTEPK